MLKAPLPYFGGKSGAVDLVWSLLGDPTNYVEPFAGSAAMLLGRPSIGHTETINDKDGFVANFWRSVAFDIDGVIDAVDWPCNEIDLFARHMWLVTQAAGLNERLSVDPDYFDAKIAGWWCWGACNWIGGSWCSGDGPWSVIDGAVSNAGRGVRRQLPHLWGGQGVSRRLPHLSAGQGRREFIAGWFYELRDRLRNVRVACGDWRRVLSTSVTTRHGDTGIFLDPPYTKGAMDYAAGGVGGGVSDDVREWCKLSGTDPLLKIVLCGHAGEHDELLAHGWETAEWEARKGYAQTDGARENSASETVWYNANCTAPIDRQGALF